MIPGPASLLFVAGCQLLKTSIRSLATMTHRDRDTIRKHVHRKGLDPDNLRGIDVFELRPDHRLEERMGELLRMLADTVSDADIPSPYRCPFASVSTPSRHHSLPRHQIAPVQYALPALTKKKKKNISTRSGISW